MRKVTRLLVSVCLALSTLFVVAPAAHASCTNDICWDRVCNGVANWLREHDVSAGDHLNCIT